MDMVESNIISVNDSKLKPYENESLLNILIIITILTIMLCIFGLYVEFSKALTKPNQDETEEWVSR